MSFNNSPVAGFEEAVKTADKILRKKNPKFRKIGTLLVSKELRLYGYYCYYYLRWVDDFIDDNRNSTESKKIFFSSELNLVSAIASGKNVELNFPEEYFLVQFINYSILIGKPHLADLIIIMMKTIDQDINRLENDGIFSEAELQKYLDAEAESLFGIANIFLFPQKEIEYKNKFSCIKTFIKFSLVKHLIEDIDLGYVNISKEEIAMFNLDYDNLINDRNLKDWYSYKISKFKQEIVTEMEIVKVFPFKMKFFWFWVFPYCFHKFYRFKLYKYNPQEMKRKKLFKELYLYSFSIINIFRLFFKIFFSK